jgi:hypothetical protein
MHVAGSALFVKVPTTRSEDAIHDDATHRFLVVQARDLRKVSHQVSPAAANPALIGLTGA